MASFDAYPVLIGGLASAPPNFSLGGPCYWKAETTGLRLPYCPPTPHNVYRPPENRLIYALELGTGDPFGNYDAIDLVGTPRDRRALRLYRLAVATVFTDRRVNDDDPLPDPEDIYRGGSWFETADPDDPIETGTRVWLLKRAILRDPTIEQLREYLYEGFQDWITDGIADEITVEVERNGASRVDVVVWVTEPTGARTPIRFPWLWEAIRNA